MVKKETNKRNKLISILNNILGFYYEGNSLTDTAIYICENKLIDDLYFALDNLNMCEIVDDGMIIALAQILTIYLKKYNASERLFLNFLKNFKNYDEDLVSFELKKIMDGYNIKTADESLLNMKRYKNLKLIDLTDEQINYMYGIVKGLNVGMEIKEQEKSNKRIQISINQKLVLYEDLLKDLYKQYKNGKSLGMLCEQIDNKAETFYNNIMFIKDYLDSDIKSFSIRLASFYYENFLAKKYKITYFYNKNIYEACDDIYNETHISPISLGNQFNNYIKYSPIMNSKNNLSKIELRKKMLEKVVVYYSQNYDKKQAERRNKDRQILNDNRLISAEKLISDIINSGDTVEDYCINNNIEMSIISNTIAILKKSDSNAYNKFNSYCNSIYYNKRQHMLNEVFNAVESIKNGVKTDKGTREYDVIDYYKTKDLSLINFDYLRDNLPKGDFITFIRFIKNNTLQEAYLELTPENILKTTFFINSETNVANEIKLADKERIMVWLENNNIPLNSITFIAALKRFSLGFLDEIELQNSSEKKVK